MKGKFHVRQMTSKILSDQPELIYTGWTSFATQHFSAVGITELSSDVAIFRSIA
jgi:hypothetical protein